MPEYICIFCNNYKGCCFNDIKRHLIKKKNCMIISNNKNNQSKFTDDELFVFSIIPYSKDTHYNKNILINIKNIKDSKNELLETITKIYKEKIKNCPYCYKNYQTNQDVKNHIILECFMNNKLKYKINNINIISNNTINNNITNINPIINNNFNIEINYPISFNEKWFTNHIKTELKDYIMVSQNKFTNLLEEILQNKLNLNVVINTEHSKELGKVFINNDEKYKVMEIDEILKETIKKLQSILLDFLDNAIINKCTLDDIFDSNILFNKCKELIIEKKNNYFQDKNIQQIVNNFLIEKFNNKSKDSEAIYNLIENRKENSTGF